MSTNLFVIPFAWFYAPKRLLLVFLQLVVAVLAAFYRARVFRAGVPLHFREIAILLDLAAIALEQACLELA